EGLTSDAIPSRDQEERHQALGAGHLPAPSKRLRLKRTPVVMARCTCSSMYSAIVTRATLGREAYLQEETGLLPGVLPRHIGGGARYPRQVHLCGPSSKPAPSEFGPETNRDVESEAPRGSSHEPFAPSPTRQLSYSCRL